MQKPIHNIKVTEYENGLVEIRKYSNPLCLPRDEKKVIRKRNATINADYTFKFNPFTEKEELVPVHSDEYCEDRQARSERSSYSRTVNKIYSLSRQCEWEYFLTLTFDKEKVDRYNYDLCCRRLSEWLKYQRKTYSENMQYVFVPELHKDGAIHFHGVIANVGNVDISWKGKTVDRKKLPNGRWVMLKKPMKLLEVGGWHYGFSNATVVLDVQKVSTYITKYITKELCCMEKGKKRYFRSKNIPEPKESYLLSEDSDDLQIIIDSFGLDVSYSKVLKGEHQTVEYIYLNSIEKEKRENE